MKGIYNKPFEKRKKISLDLNEKTLQFIDKIAGLTESNRTVVIESFIGKGIPPLVSEIESNWKLLSNKGNLDENKKKKVKKLLIDLKKILSEE